jgi:hypothetical protein
MDDESLEERASDHEGKVGSPRGEVKPLPKRYSVFMKRMLVRS